VLIVAISAGIPVGASRLSGIPELVEDEVSGLLVPPGDSLALANALRRLADSSDLRRRLGRAGRQRVRRDFDVAVNAQLLANRFAGR
jgi:colanic acid/amylovoran biosynthesis glycosyltransferase